MKNVAEEIRFVTEYPMSLLGFQVSESVDDTMYSMVAYISEKGRVAFTTDVREEELVVRITRPSMAEETDIRMLSKLKLDLRTLGGRVRADDPEAVRNWLSSRMDLIVQLLSDSGLWS